MTIKIHRIGIHLVRTNLCHNKKRQVQGYHLVLKNYSTETNAQGVKKEEKIEFNPSLIYASKNIFPQPTVLPVEKDSQNFQKSIKISPEAEEIFHPPTYIKNDAHVSGLDAYHELYRQSMEEPNKFWKSVAKELHFEKWSDKGLEYNFDHQKGEVFVKFMEGAKTNMAYNCLERNIQKGLGSKIAYIWEGNEPGDQMTITYQELLEQVSKFAEVLRTKGVKKGDVVAIYLPMTIELPIAMLACARIGAIHSVVFAGFSSDALANRIHQAKAKILITADGFYRGHKAIDLKTLADKAFSICHDQGHDIDSVIMVEHLKRIRTPQGAIPPEVKINKKTDSLWNKEMEAASSKNLQTSKIEWNDSEDPLFILYTSGSTGTPKGLVHTTTGYMTYAYEAAKKIFDSKPDDVFWCTADIGWITGHTFGVYGALLNGMTSMLFEGVPNYPDASRMWQLVEKYKVSKLYTSPTAVRSLMDCPTEMVTDYSRDTLKILGVVGEPINRPAWRWLHKVVGGEKCAIVDTYWQTETGGPMLTPLSGATPTKPGSATMPFFGVDPVLVDDQGVAKNGQVDGNLCFARAWPGMARTIWGDHARFIKTYFSTFPGLYFTGDGARRDQDSYYWVGGRVDDKLNVSGHLLSTSEIECVLTHHPTVQEAAVVAAPHPSKGQVPYAFVVLKQSRTLTADLIHEIKQEVRNKIGPFAAPEVVHGACGLPKTRSGKITRRILRIIAEGDHKANLGDTSTLIDEQVIAHLWETRPDVQFCK